MLQLPRSLTPQARTPSLPSLRRRSTFVTAPGTLGQPLCPWAPARHEYQVSLHGRAGLDFGHEDAVAPYKEFALAVKLHRIQMRQRPCFTSFEMPWLEAVRTVFAPAGLTPLVITMARRHTLPTRVNT